MARVDERAVQGASDDTTRSPQNVHFGARCSSQVRPSW